MTVMKIVVFLPVTKRGLRLVGNMPSLNDLKEGPRESFLSVRQIEPSVGLKSPYQP